MTWRKKIQPLTEIELDIVDDMLANVGNILAAKRGVADSGALLRRHHRLVTLLGLTMPAPAMPTASELRAKRYQFLNDDEIDAALEEIEKATCIFNGRVAAKVIDAKLKLERTLLMRRGREAWETERNHG
jgi:hypothetical protein